MAKSSIPGPLRVKSRKAIAEAEEPYVHIYHHGAVCETDGRGHATPGGRSLVEIVVDATEGFIPLWDSDVMLRWRFQPRSMAMFRTPEQARSLIRTLFGEGLMLWEDAAPVTFCEVDEAWDFEIAVNPAEKCNPNGCTLARAFFPDAGQHELLLYPTLFEQSREEQIETIAHELGHVFGLRHFFADIRETRWRSEIFGEHSPFSIMNYGPQSVMTQHDRDDLKKLYQLAWAGELASINGTPIRLVRPYSEFRQLIGPQVLAVS
jgi:hypothetical protein